MSTSPAAVALLSAIAAYLVLMFWWASWHFRQSSARLRKLRDGEATAPELYRGWVRQNFVRSLPAAMALVLSAVIPWMMFAEGTTRLAALPLGLLAFAVTMSGTVGLAVIEVVWARRAEV